MFTSVVTWWFKFRGWKIINDIPQELNKYLVIVAPHTSNVDFFIGVAVRNILNRDIKFMAKKELFRFPLKNFLLKLGGYPVNRERNTKMVDYVSGLFRSHDYFAITMTPEGTRKRVEKWKTGFYRIAEKANVPVILCGLDYASKRVILQPPFYVTGNLEKDLYAMKTFFATIKGKHPENGVFL